MTESEVEFQERLRTRIEGMIFLAMRVSEPPISAAVDAASEQGLLDDHTATFLLASRRLLLATAVSLSAAEDLHRLRRPAHGRSATCMSCGTEGRCRTTRRIADTLAMYLPGPVAAGRAEALLKADSHFNAGDTNDHLVGVHEILDGYVTWGVPGRYVGQDDESMGSPSSSWTSALVC